MKYTILDFRQNLREAFDKAMAGEDVLIKRYDQVFRLVPEGKYEARKEDLEVLGGVIKAGEKIKEDVERFAEPPKTKAIPKTADEVSEDLNRKIAADAFSGGKKFEYCQHGQVKGLCKKGCK